MFYADKYNQDSVNVKPVANRTSRELQDDMRRKLSIDNTKRLQSELIY